MKSIRLSTALKLALLACDAATRCLLVSSYTFDPMNNSWKPSGGRRKNNNDRTHHHSSSSASSYSFTPAEPIPVATTGAEFSYNEDDIVRHHYTLWGVGGEGGESNNDPAFVPKASVVEIQYNKKTGEVLLLDEEGVVTPEEYKRLMKAVKYSSEHGDDDSINGTTASEQRLQSQEREADVAIGTTLYVDPEDLDPTDIIDTEGQDLPVQELASVQEHAEVSKTAASVAPPPAPPQQEFRIPEYTQQLHDEYTQQLQDYPEPSVQWHESEYVQPTETFNSYSIHQPVTETNHPVQQYQHYEYAQRPMQETAPVVAQQQSTDHYYYQQQQQQEPEQHAQAYEGYHSTAVAEQPLPSTNDEIMEEGYQDDGAYRKSRGFGFAHRRGFFTGSD